MNRLTIASLEFPSFSLFLFLFLWILYIIFDIIPYSSHLNYNNSIKNLIIEIDVAFILLSIYGD